MRQISRSDDNYLADNQNVERRDMDILEHDLVSYAEHIDVIDKETREMAKRDLAIIKVRKVNQRNADIQKRPYIKLAIVFFDKINDFRRMYKNFPDKNAKKVIKKFQSMIKKHVKKTFGTKRFYFYSLTDHKIEFGNRVDYEKYRENFEKVFEAEKVRYQQNNITEVTRGYFPKHNENYLLIPLIWGKNVGYLILLNKWDKNVTQADLEKGQYISRSLSDFFSPSLFGRYLK